MEGKGNMELQQHINECKKRVNTINIFVSGNGGAYKGECKKNISVLEKVINALEKYQGYEALEKQGRLLELPCAVGDTVYEVQDLRKRIQPYTVVAVHISNCGNLYGWELKDGKGVYSNVNGFSEYAIGKHVFLTREEAETALKKLEEGEENGKGSIIQGKAYPQAAAELAP